ncbi:MAG: metallophosphoesterase [Planctomycetes bacterium]|nr:metallophosphoesterase [Planctomycetota bacterium]
MQLDQRSSSSRREVLRYAGAAAAALAVGSSAGAVAAAVNAADRKRVLRIAHLTDVHVQPELHGDHGLAACLHHVQEHARPDLIIGTGDSIMDSMETAEDRVKMLWGLWQRVWKAECSLPAEHCIGNHDVWGIHKAASKSTGTEPLYGKKWVMSLHGWDRPYRSFGRAGWHFIALDSITHLEDDYLGRLDDRQFEWLVDDLSRVDARTPVLVFSHIPLFSAAAFLDGQHEKAHQWRVPASIMHIDARRVKDLFRKHPNVKLCLSGHLHLVERVDYLGVSYLCNGAVSGGWWKADHQECQPGYGVIDLYADGTFESKHVLYGWKYAEA